MPRVNIPGVGRVNFPDSMTTAQINKEAEALYRSAAGGAAPSASTQAGPQPKAESKGKSWMLDALPSLGGMLGGGVAGAAALPSVPVGGPLGPVLASTAGAGLGGAVGEGARQMGYRAMGWDVPDPLSREALTLMAGQGMGQAGAEAMGLGMSAGVGRLAKPLMNASLSLPKRVLEEGLVEELGKKSAMQSPSMTALEERIRPSILGKGGSRKAAELVEQSSAAEDAANYASGRRFSLAELASGFEERATKEIGRPLTAQEQARVRLKAKYILDEVAQARTHGAAQGSRLSLSADEAKRAKQTLQKWGAGAFNKNATNVRGGSADPNDYASLSSDIRGLMTDPQTGIPGMERILKDKQSRVGLEKAMVAAEARPFSFTRNVSIPTTIAGGAAMIPGGNNATDAAVAFALAQLLTNRGIQGQAGLAAQSQILQAILRQTPRGAGALLFPPEGFPAPADSTR